MHKKKFSIPLGACLLLGIISFQPRAYALRLSRESLGHAYQACRATFINAAKQVAPLLVADGIVLVMEMIFNRFRAGAYGHRGQGVEPVDVPEEIGHIAPETVPGSIARIIRLINTPERLKAAGGVMHKGILLHGEPGVGKSQLGYYIARATGAKVIYKSAAGLIDPEQGSGAAGVRELFDPVYNPSIWTRFTKFLQYVGMRLKRRRVPVEKPVVLILDEIDAIGCKREDQVDEKDRAREAERTRTLEQLLPYLDGMNEQTTLPKVFVVGTTNRPLELFDKALVRPGRLRPKHVPALNEVGRLAVLEYHARLRGRRLADDVNFVEIARQTDGYTGDELQELVNEAVCRAEVQEEGPISQRHLLDVLREEHEEKGCLGARRLEQAAL